MLSWFSFRYLITGPYIHVFYNRVPEHRYLNNLSSVQFEQQ